jgi:hypothetical protein
MSLKQPLYQVLANLIEARNNCIDHGKSEWKDNHTDRILDLVKEHMPSGSGFDSGTTIDLDASTAEKIVFHTSFHHMNEDGFYDGWTEHKVTVRPSLGRLINIRISGIDRNMIKEYMDDEFQCALVDTMVSY